MDARQILGNKKRPLLVSMYIRQKLGAFMGAGRVSPSSISTVNNICNFKTSLRNHHLEQDLNSVVPIIADNLAIISYLQQLNCISNPIGAHYNCKQACNAKRCRLAAVLRGTGIAICCQKSSGMNMNGRL